MGCRCDTTFAFTAGCGGTEGCRFRKDRRVGACLGLLQCHGNLACRGGGREEVTRVNVDERHQRCACGGELGHRRPKPAVDGGANLLWYQLLLLFPGDSNLRHHRAEKRPGSGCGGGRGGRRKRRMGTCTGYTGRARGRRGGGRERERKGGLVTP